MTRVVFLGPPGAGKGTQAVRFATDRGVPHVSTGDMLRAAMAAGTALGEQARELVDAGHLVPDELMTGIVSERIDDADCAQGFVLDGFPRTVRQAELLDRELTARGLGLDCVLQIDVPVEELERRLRERGQGRSDDAPDVIHHRMQVYETSTAPLVGLYEERGLLRRVDGVGSMDQVASRLAEAAGQAA